MEQEQEMRNIGRLIIIEGRDRSGKGTQTRLLTERLTAAGISHVEFREPGSTAFGELMRNVLLNSPVERCTEAELMLFMASRMENIKSNVRPGIEKHDVVLLDRFMLSSIVYQGYGMNVEDILAMSPMVYRALGIDKTRILTLVLDIPDTDVDSRSVNTEPDIIERRKQDFQRAVAEGYRGFKILPDGTKTVFKTDWHGDYVINGAREPAVIAEEIWTHVKTFLQIP